jgi:hypothetical protein|tara:strand:- start:4408 stop:4905 length:498 start_codon:yes stop_codon:yes gene_type:complete
MTGNYAKNKALINKLKQPKVRDVDFGLGKPEYINHPIDGIIKSTELKPYDHLDSSTYPSNPKVREKLFSDTLQNPEIKSIARKFVDKKRENKPKAKIDFTPIDNSILQITKDITEFENKVRKQKQDREFLNKIQEQLQDKPTPKPKQGLERVLESDEVYLRRKGI